MIGNDTFIRLQSTSESLEVGWDLDTMSLDVVEYTSTLEEKALQENSVDWWRVEYETQSAVEEVQLEALEKHLETIVENYDNDLRKYLETIRKRKRQNKKTKANRSYENYVRFCREMNLDQLLYKYRVNTEEDLWWRLTDEEKKLLGPTLPGVE